jgi:hypothetical protein
MKSILSSLLIGFSALTCLAENIKWTHQQIDHEDATSTHYYLFKSNGHSIDRVRVIWNGGAQNPPSVTDYLLEDGDIKTRRYVGKREALAAIFAGKDESLEIKNGYVLIGHLLRPSRPSTTLTDEQRTDLSNLIDLLAREKEPFSIDETRENSAEKTSETEDADPTEIPPKAEAPAKP